VALVVPAELDLDHRVFIGPTEALPPGVDPRHIPQHVFATLRPEHVENRPLSNEDEAKLHRERATSLDALGRNEEARAARELAERVERGEGSGGAGAGPGGPTSGDPAPGNAATGNPATGNSASGGSDR
jgi:hypothetical protein